MSWRNTLFVVILVGFLAAPIATASVTYDFKESYTYTDPNDIFGDLSLYAVFEFVGPNFLSGDNFFTANQLNGCFIGGLVAGSIYGSSCGGISIDVSGNTVGIDEFYGTGQGQPAAGATFTVPSDQFGTWSVFELPATFPAGTVGSSVLTISSTPEPATVILTALALLTFLVRCLWRYSRAKPIDVW